MNTAKRTIFGIAIMAAILSCNKHGTDMPGSQDGTTSGQQFTVAVESIGELFTYGDNSTLLHDTYRSITGITPSQTFDIMTVIIVEYGSPAKVVFKTSVTGWSNPDNKASIPWSNSNGQGRYAFIRLTGDECLEEEKAYIAYAIGYQAGTYGNYEPFEGIGIGDEFKITETASVPDGSVAEEIFAGAQIFWVENGRILSRRDEDSPAETGLIVLRRQVAGTFGYFTHIPAEVQGTDVAKLRLVAAKCNRTVIFGGFRGVDDPFDFIKDNVINGMDPRTDFDASMAGSGKADAFTVYEAELRNWFPGNPEDERLPYDSNGDGYLGAEDSNWQMDTCMYRPGEISLSPGTVFGDRFLIPFAVTPEDVDSGMMSFQLQLLDTGNRILKYWEVTLRDPDATDNGNRTIVSLPEGTTGRTLVSIIDNADTEDCFSIVRNRLYTMGEKSQSQNYGMDVPVSLDSAKMLVMDARHKWSIQNAVIFN